MEDILASIRRIIADDQDGGRPAALAPPHAPEPQDPRHAEDGTADEEILDLAEIAEPAPSFHLADDRGGPSHVDLDAFARALPEPEEEVSDHDRDLGHGHGEPEPDHSVTSPPTAAASMAAPILSALARHAEPASAVPQAAPPEPAAVAPAPSKPIHPHAQAAEPEAAAPPRAKPEPVQQSGQAAAQSGDDRLISSMADSAVTQAFNMLTHTVFSQNAMTLEDVVKDMLRPLLKDWLDDNLPPLVERLVRAEIERVARGGGRR
jgi:cell pole-organizing protein PopZ